MMAEAAPAAPNFVQPMQQGVERASSYRAVMPDKFTGEKGPVQLEQWLF